MLVARNLGYMTQVHSTLNYSRKLAALGRLMAGVAHEVKNPLNAMTIHLELLKGKLAAGLAAGCRVRSPSSRPLTDPDPQPPTSDASTATSISSASEIQRLDQVLNGFLKFARPDELKLQPTSSPGGDQRHRDLDHARSRAAAGHGEARMPAGPAADQRRSRHAAAGAAEPRAQRLPGDARRRHRCGISCRAASRGRVEIDIRRHRRRHSRPRTCRKSSTSTSRPARKGSGIGLSMVYRIVQLHDGEVEVQSTPGRGTRFRLVFPAGVRRDEVMSYQLIAIDLRAFVTGRGSGQPWPRAARARRPRGRTSIVPPLMVPPPPARVIDSAS